jgi:hypothetical protein
VAAQMARGATLMLPTADALMRNGIYPKMSRYYRVSASSW